MTRPPPTLEQKEQIVVTVPSVHGGTMGRKDNDSNGWRDGGDLKTEADRKLTGNFSQFTLYSTSSEIGNSADPIKCLSFPDEVVLTLGVGAYGKVVECIDRDKGEHVAVKIVKNIDCFREIARSEIAVLQEINSLDDDNIFACVRMMDWFDHEGHICIVFELLGLSTYEFLRQNNFLPFNVEQIRHMAFQIFRAVCFLHRNKLTHTDLKPENILFVCSDYNLEYNDETGKILILYSYAVYEGQGEKGKQHYVHNERLNWDEQSSSDEYVRKQCKPLKKYMRRKTDEERQLFDLLSCMLEYDVCRRITLEEALWHPFFSPMRVQKQQRS
ncbi:Dual specificity protein kinase CLK4 [Collichthys lucidus]|uniref:dual-specificity kinase n=1 Tax=Collichthys lucidus TaxID=240159 RepID=A0A4U5V721_COLLU|nr:Dual specificity protein kinase CLK4 [Collichthys lucidus]